MSTKYLKKPGVQGSHDLPIGKFTPLQVVASENIANELLEFIRSDRGRVPSAFAGGRKHLATSLVVLSTLQVGHSISCDSTTTAVPVIPDRAALPDVGGSIDPAVALPPLASCLFMSNGKKL